ncbi:MAG: hypothetical protein JWM27_3792 [Gemmatimonadetes bacterium]|nr:hypothetical protein [Gemmatimonadota bacterium]
MNRTLAAGPARILRRLAVALAVAPILAACSSDDALRPKPIEPSPTLSGALLRCEAHVREGTVSCAADAGTTLPAGVRARILGGQGLYVRLISSGVGYAGGVFSFTTTVQNLSSLAMATADGATRDDAGVQAFLMSAPTVTSGSGTITVANATGQGMFLSPNQDFFQYGGKIGGVDQAELGADGILAAGEVSTGKQWQFNVPVSATGFTFQVYVATQTPSGTVSSVAPQITGISPATLVPGGTATLTGYNFNPAFASNSVTIGGRAATVTAGNATQLTVTVPCTASGTAPVQVTQGGKAGMPYGQPLQALQRTLAVGQAVIVTTLADVACNEITATGVASRYFVTVYNAGSSPTSAQNFQISGDVTGIETPGTLAESTARMNQLAASPLTAVPSLTEIAGRAFEQRAEERHMDLLERNRQMYDRLEPRFAHDKRMHRSVSGVSADPVPPPATRLFHVSNINATAPSTICNSYYSINANRVYYNGKIAIYEDADSTPAGFLAANNPSMQNYYNKIGDQFNADMEPILSTNFGDVLRRDAETDNNGVLVALFTPIINNHFSGVAGFVVSCDQFPNDAGAGDQNTTSNFGEYFYAYQPNVTGTGYSANTADNWYRTIRSTFIHESKHATAYAARVANNAPTFESSWLEEGLARTSEELWARQAVYGPLAWKGNTGYGTAANPVNIYCDVRPSGWPECDSNTRGPASIMQRHFTSLYTEMFGSNGRLLSPFGRTPSDNASYFYAVSWSLIRYSIDRYGASDAAFLTNVTQATTSGQTTLANAAGAPIDQILGGWALSLAADDYPGTAGLTLDAQQPTWNFRNVYAGLNADFPSTYTLPYPLMGTAVTFGSFGPVSVTTMYGGGALWYQLSGTQTASQLIRLQANGGGALNSNLRVAIVRVQ